MNKRYIDFVPKKSDGVKVVLPGNSSARVVMPSSGVSVAMPDGEAGVPEDGANVVIPVSSTRGGARVRDGAQVRRGAKARMISDVRVTKGARVAAPVKKSVGKPVEKPEPVAQRVVKKQDEVPSAALVGEKNTQEKNVQGKGARPRRKLIQLKKKSAPVVQTEKGMARVSQAEKGATRVPQTEKPAGQRVRELDPEEIFEEAFLKAGELDAKKKAQNRSPFLSGAKVVKRPLSRNVYPKKEIITPKEEPAAPVTIIEKPEKDSKARLIITIIITIILGAAAGTVAFLLLPK
ncbi:hypothetical protein IKE79_01275 [Candidatus Saccharibacteria bacterium]|nr:hypothetical protein [Candidatus Saccharibacteria bacterium]